MRQTFLSCFRVPTRIKRDVRISLKGKGRACAIDNVVSIRGSSHVFRLCMSRTFIRRVTRKRPLFRFQLHCANTSDVRLRRLGTSVTTFLSTGSISRSRVFCDSGCFSVRNFGSNIVGCCVPITVLLLITYTIIVCDVFFVSMGNGVQRCKHLGIVNAAPGRVQQVIQQRKLLLSLYNVPLKLLIKKTVKFTVFPTR